MSWLCEFLSVNLRWVISTPSLILVRLIQANNLFKKIYQKPGSIAGACKPSRWAANSFKAQRLWESLDCVPDSLQVTAAERSPRGLAT